MQNVAMDGLHIRLWHWHAVGCVQKHMLTQTGSSEIGGHFLMIFDEKLGFLMIFHDF
jgi:hypothetical protein